LLPVVGAVLLRKLFVRQKENTMMALLRRFAVFGTLLATLLFAGPALQVAAEGGFAAGDTAVVATTEGDLLALREGPGTDYPVFAFFPAGTRLTILDGPLVGDEGLSWYEVSDGEFIGWSAAAWLTADDGLAPTSPPAAETTTDTVLTVSATAGANLRAQPTLAGEIILLVPQGAGVLVLSDSVSADGYDWVLVRYGDVDGWVASILLDDTGASAPVTVSTGSMVTSGAAA